MPAFGETRTDGKRFRGHQTTKDGKTYEQWLSPEAWEARKNRQTRWRRADYRNNPEKNRTKSREWMRVCRKRDPLRFALTAAKKRAKAAGLPFTITRGDVPIPEFCPVFGVPLSFASEASEDTSPSIDRIDNALGYVPGNVVIVSHRANRLKADATLTEMQLLVHFYESLTPCAT
jgi:hypothetical protein